MQVGAVSWPVVITSLRDSSLTEYPKNTEKLDIKARSMVATVNVIEGETNLLIGLDMQRHMMIQLDAVNNKCWKIDRSRPGVERFILMAQVAGTGLLCIRVDNWEAAEPAYNAFGRSSPCFETMNVEKIRAEYPGQVVGEEHDAEVLDTNISVKMPEHFDLVDSDDMLETEAVGADNPYHPSNVCWCPEAEE